MKQKLITITLSSTVILAALLIFVSVGFYNLPKIWVLAIGGFFLILLLLANYHTLEIDRKDVILFIFLALMFISTLLSSNGLKSIIGEKNRYEGLITFITYACIYLTAKKFFYYEKVEPFLNLFFYVSMGIGILGILQNYVEAPTLIPLFSKGICSTFGNSNFFGSYISLVLPIAIIFFIFNGKKKGLILSLVLFFNLLASGTRSAWVAFGIVAILGVVYLIKQKDKTYFKRFGILSIGFFVIFLYLFFVPTGTVFRIKSDQMKSDLAKLASALEEKNGDIARYAGSNRIEIWRISLKLVGQKPIFGCGPDNLKEGILNSCTLDAYYFYHRSGTVIDKAHNEYLHIAATLGIPALLVYLVFLCSILQDKLKNLFQDEITFTFCLVILSYLVQAFFNVSTIGTAPLFWMILGLVDNSQFVNSLKHLFSERLYLK